MPIVRRPPVLQSVYRVTLDMIRRWEMPTELIEANRCVFRAKDKKDLRFFVSGNTRTVNRATANESALVVRDQNLDQARFTGQSLSRVPSIGGLYCSLQPPALVNEVLHYARDSRTPRSEVTGFPELSETMQTKYVAKISLMSPVLAADLSPHNPSARRFVEAIGDSGEFQSALRSPVARESALSEKPIWDQLTDSMDCSVARGIGLAVAHSGFLGALIVRSVRPSPGLPTLEGETGDNLIFLRNNGPVAGLSIEEVYTFPPGGRMEIFPVEFEPTR